MAIVESPNAEIRGIRRYKDFAVLKKKRQKYIVSMLPRETPFEFFSQETKKKLRDQIYNTWDKLAPEEKDFFCETGKKVMMEGLQFFSVFRRRCITSAIYTRAHYGATVNDGIITTRYTRIYSIGKYGIIRYGQS